MIELTRGNDEVRKQKKNFHRVNWLFVQFKSKVSVYEYRFQDNEDTDKRNRSEISKLQRDIQDITRENEDRAHEINVKRLIMKHLINRRYFRNGDVNMKH